jgi:hypothetical protein
MRLGANAGKYGARSKSTGRLDVGWGTEGETFKMIWMEHDGPWVDPPQRRGCPAGASDYEVGASLACDTPAQVERFVALFTGDAQATIGTVNAEE